jgi:hypothetical protein
MVKTTITPNDMTYVRALLAIKQSNPITIDTFTDNDMSYARLLLAIKHSKRSKRSG